MIIGLIVGFLARSWFSLLLISLVAPLFRVGLLYAGGQPSQQEVSVMAASAYASCVAIAAVVYGIRLAIRATGRASH